MEDSNDIVIEGRVATAPTLGKMPGGTPILWFLLETQESFDDSATGIVRYRSSQFRIEILGKNVSTYADKIQINKRIRVKGFLRNDNGVVKIRVYRLVILRTFYEGLTQGYETAIALLQDSKDINRTLAQLENMREACDPLNHSSVAN